jgi:hypothetical protein
MTTGKQADRQAVEYGDQRVEAAGLGGLTDGFISLDEHSAADFISRCARLRFWPRQASIAERADHARAAAR